MKVRGDWLYRPGVRALFALLGTAGYQVFAVGGAVRDDLLGLSVADVDFATDAPPDTVADLLTTAGYGAVPTGIEHGTVTAVISGTGYEITTFRKDVATDGRRAVVAFAQDPGTDAMRRDFTINALYAGPDGHVIDPVDGLGDIVHRRIRFIGDAADRIAEDALRILRFFRFHAGIGGADAVPDPTAMTAIGAAADAVLTLSAERIGREFIKILGGGRPSVGLGPMAEAGVLPLLLPDADVAAVARIEKQGQQHWTVRLAALTDAPDLGNRLRLSKRDARRITAIRAAVACPDSWSICGYRHGAEAAEAALVLSSPDGPDARDLAAIRDGALRRFPVRAADLDMAPGPAIGRELERLEKLWIASGFRLSRDELLDHGAASGGLPPA